MAAFAGSDRIQRRRRRGSTCRPSPADAAACLGVGPQLTPTQYYAPRSSRAWASAICRQLQVLTFQAAADLPSGHSAASFGWGPRNASGQGLTHVPRLRALHATSSPACGRPRLRLAFREAQGAAAALETRRAPAHYPTRRLLWTMSRSVRPPSSRVPLPPWMREQGLGPAETVAARPYRM